MATYKVIQDIEAEDKLLGPLTLRQFVYAGACVLMLYLTYLAATKGAAFMAIIFLPLAAVSGFFAWPWGRDQPTEVWALAKIRFLFKPRKRIWDQNGAKELVTITVPKKIEAVYTNGLSQTEVRSRLEALANTIDSRGWAIKNVNVNLFAQPSAMFAEPDSDRLISLNSIPQVNEVSDFDVRAGDDMLDEQNNAQAQRMDNMIAASTRAHRQQIMQAMSQPAAAAAVSPVVQPATQSTVQPQPDYWFLKQPAATPPSGSTMFTPQVVTAQTPVATPFSQVQSPTSTPPAAQPADNQLDEAALMQTLRAQDQRNAGANAYGHLHTLQPLSARSRTAPATRPQPAPPKVTPANNAAILQLARNDDLNVATIAREAQKRAESQDEVVISLH